MSKPQDGAVKPKTGEPKHAEQKHSEGAPSHKGKEKEAPTGFCTSVGCKMKAARFDFCEEHFEQFKFGLIKKTGAPVPDYEKKFEHYMAYKAKKTAQKAA